MTHRCSYDRRRDTPVMPAASLSGGRPSVFTGRWSSRSFGGIGPGRRHRPLRRGRLNGCPNTSYSWVREAVLGVLVGPAPPSVGRLLRSARRGFLPGLLPTERGEVEHCPRGREGLAAPGVDEVRAV